ncbi:hypothetical protein EJ08DRAFT_652702 [Tothia fuscella]|uniref:Hamartin n=1 Tax=Tothia fuscella TaxID=1048955 RepID=A0A9P4TV79_9PEZI|nr:hypothetical protein EJ08DRAFT_652702 [Tothia fuscella]
MALVFGTLKDTVKAIQSTFAGNSHPLPDELQQTIEFFLDNHHQIADADSQRLHEDLLAIHGKYVANNPELHGLFVHLLRQLRPTLRGVKRLEEWWTLVIRPTVDAVGHKRHTIEDAREFLLGIMVFDQDEDLTGENAELSRRFTRKVMDAYFVRSKIPTSESEVVSPEDEFIAQELEGILVAFGRKKPQQFLVAIDEQIVKKERRLQALSLLSSFVRLQPPHLHLVLETSIIQHLYNCLLIDTSGTVVDLALTILIMFLPHITTSLVSSLPTLFIIYARILCWEQSTKDGDTPTQGSDAEKFLDSEPAPVLSADASWEALPRLFNSVGAIIPKTSFYFTFLYGLFPLNFMNFIRKPRRYLKLQNYPGAADLILHQDTIRQRSETHRAGHRLHPSFFSTTSDDELIDNKWLKSDPADLVSECLGLCIGPGRKISDPGPPPTTKLPELPKTRKSSMQREALLAPDDEGYSTSPTEYKSQQNSWRHTHSTTLTAPSTTAESQRLPLHKSSGDRLDLTLDSLRDVPFGTRTRDTSPSAKSRSHSRSQSRPQSRSQSRPQSRHGQDPQKKDVYGFFPTPPLPIPSPTLQAFSQALSRSPINDTGTNDSTALLQREVMLLKNDLNFERFQKAQYLAQIGQLQRKHIKDATVDFQNQNVLNAKRTLQAKLDKANDLYAQLKKETTTSRNQSKRYEEQLSQKLKSYREEEKQWQAEMQMLRHELEKAQAECESLKQLVVDSEIREHDSRDQLDTQALDLQEYDALQNKLQDLEDRLREYQFRDLEIDRAREDQDLLRNELESARLNLDSRDLELERMQKTYEQKILMLETRARQAAVETTAATPGQISASIQQIIDNALAASHSKLQQVKKNYTRLLSKYTELELKYQELEAQSRPSNHNPLFRPSSVLSLTQYADDATKVSAGGGTVRENTLSRLHSLRKPHAFSDPLLVDTDEISPIDKSSLSNSHSNTYHDRPSRMDAYNQSRARRGISPPAVEYEYGGNSHDFHANTTGAVSNRHSTQLLDGNGGKGTAADQVRVYGRGGAQKKVPKEEKKKDKSKTGGFRGLKGIM